MRKEFRSCAFVSALLLPLHPGIPAAEGVPDTLRRQTQELLDAITAGASPVWDRYLDPAVRYVDESGNVTTKKEMVESVKPLPEGISGSLRSRLEGLAARLGCDQHVRVKERKKRKAAFPRKGGSGKPS